MIADKDRRIIEEMAAKYHAKRVVLFGSCLSSQRETRDIDIGVEGIAEEDFFTFYGDLLCALSKPIDVVDFESAMVSACSKQCTPYRELEWEHKLYFESVPASILPRELSELR